MTQAIFISSGTIPCVIGKLIMWVKGSEIIFIDCFIIDMGIVSWPAALHDRKLLAISVISALVAILRKIEFGKRPERKFRWELGEDCIFLTKLGPILEK